MQHLLNRIVLKIHVTKLVNKLGDSTTDCHLFNSKVIIVFTAIVRLKQLLRTAAMGKFSNLIIVSTKYNNYNLSSTNVRPLSFGDWRIEAQELKPTLREDWHSCFLSNNPSFP